MTRPATSSEDDEEITAVKRAYREKYHLDHPAPFWRITPSLSFSWTDLGKDATRFKFDARSNPRAS